MHSLLLWVLFAFPALLTSPAMKAQGQLKLMWYNVENLFHPDDHPSTADDEFVTGGPRNWSMERYRDKLTALAKVVVACGRGDPPALVGLAEVEEGRILEDLVDHPILRPYSYAWIHHEGPGSRSLEVAALYRPEKIEVLEHGSISSPYAGTGRDFLHLLIRTSLSGDGLRTGDPGRSDSLELLLIHFVSRYRGAGASAGIRIQQAAGVLELMDSLAAVRPGLPLLAGGDMNASPGDPSLIALDKACRAVPNQGYQGTYKYHGAWSHIDHFYLRKAGSGADPGESEGPELRSDLEVRAELPVIPVLLCRDENYGGWRPWRTYHGFDYQGGVSDHLPLCLALHFK